MQSYVQLRRFVSFIRMERQQQVASNKLVLANNYYGVLPVVQGNTRWLAILSALAIWWILSLLYYPTYVQLQRRIINHGVGDGLSSASRGSSAYSYNNNPVLPQSSSSSPLTPGDVSHTAAAELSMAAAGAVTNSVISYPAESMVDSCAGKYIYMYDLPPRFNEGMVANCTGYSRPWFDACRSTSNGGLGPELELDDEARALLSPNNSSNDDDTWWPLWRATQETMLDVLFHARMRRYRCLTADASEAALVYVPFYASVDMTSNLWGTSAAERDELAAALATWLEGRGEWRATGGRDHVVVTGRVTWDFRRATRDGEWGNALLMQEALRQVTAVGIERAGAAIRVASAEGRDHTKEVAVPYPTYFHPMEDCHVVVWQEAMRARARPNLFCFAGARRPEIEHSIRGELIEQCAASRLCRLMECSRGHSHCNRPASVLGLFQSSSFCLQPPGDSYTRRSFFDSILSGCIPVLFHPDSAHSQYTLGHLPSDPSSYSLFIPHGLVKARQVDLESTLSRIPPSRVLRLRQQVIDLIPSIVYAHPDHSLRRFRDAFDLTIDALLTMVHTNASDPSQQHSYQIQEGAAATDALLPIVHTNSTDPALEQSH